MKKIVGLFLIFLSSCSLFLEDEEVVRTYVYFNSNFLFINVPNQPFTGFGSTSGIVVDNLQSSTYIKSLKLTADDGTEYNVKPADIYNINSTVGAGSVYPVEIPNKEYINATIVLDNVIKKVRYTGSGSTFTKTVLERGTVQNDMLLIQSGMYSIGTMQNYEPFQIPGTSKTLGKDGYVRKVELYANGEVSVTPITNGYENTYKYSNYLDSEVLNDPVSNESSCITKGGWNRTICGDNTKKALVGFNADSPKKGTGFFTDVECTSGGCTRLFQFNYEILSDTEMKITYTSASICGQPVATPTGGIQQYSCNGNTLVFGNTYTR